MTANQFPLIGGPLLPAGADVARALIAAIVIIVRAVRAQEARDIVVPEPESEEGNG